MVKNSGALQPGFSINKYWEGNSISHDGNIENGKKNITLLRPELLTNKYLEDVPNISDTGIWGL